MSAAVEQSRLKANMFAQGEGKFGAWGWPQNPSKPKKVGFVFIVYLHFFFKSS